MKTQKEIAIELAYKFHAGQFRRDGRTPYIVHLSKVADRSPEVDSYQAVAWLHDIFEDTNAQPSDLGLAGIDEPVIEAVIILTRDKRVPYDTYLAKVRENALASVIKIQDMLHNLSDDPTLDQIRKYARGLVILTEGLGINP